jgi:hypothetical protein
VPEEAPLSQPSTDAVSADGEGKRRFVHDAMVPQLQNLSVRQVEMVDRVRHGKVCRTQA